MVDRGRREEISAGKRAALAVVLGTGAISGANAATEDGAFRVRGAGIASCAQYVEAAEARGAEFVSFAGWVDGYLTAMNRTEPGYYDLVPWQGTDLLLGALARYCGERPDEAFHVAVLNLARSLLPGAIEQKPEVVGIEATDGATSVALYDVVIRRLQAALRIRGFYEGELSGAYTDATREAVSAFQSSVGLPATGMPDQKTLANLLN